MVDIIYLIFWSEIFWALKRDDYFLKDHIGNCFAQAFQPNLKSYV